jgi:hypothetical protein
MRQYVIDELSPMESDNIDSYLKRNLEKGPMIGLYWLSLPSELLTDSQRSHKKCGPYYCGVEMENDKVRFEFLIRSHSNLHCDCIAYATPAQRDFIINFIDKMLEYEKIKS